MFKKEVKRIQLKADSLISQYFPSVRGPVSLIIIPTIFIVTIYFFTILLEIVTGKVNIPILQYEKCLASIKKDLPSDAVVNYVSTSKRTDDLINASYVLIPVRVVKGLAPMHDFLIFLDFEKVELPEFKNYTLKKNYGNGVMLFKRIVE